MNWFVFWLIAMVSIWWLGLVPCGSADKQLRHLDQGFWVMIAAAILIWFFGA